MLLGENFGRRHQRRLRAGLDRAQHGEQRHQGFAGADIALQQAQHAVRGSKIGVDFREGLQLRGGGGVAEALQRRGAQPAVAAQGPARQLAPPRAHDGEGQLPGQKLVIGQPFGRLVVRHALRRMQRAHGSAEIGPGAAGEDGLVVPFGEIRQPRQRAERGTAHEAREDARRERPDRLDPGKILRLRLRHHIIGVRHHQPVGKCLQLAGDQQLRAYGKLRQPCCVEQHDLCHARAVADDDSVRLALLRRRFVADDLHPQCRDHAGPRLAQWGRGAAVDKIARKVKQHVAHRIAADELGHERGKALAEAGQAIERRAQRGENLGTHGLTHGQTSLISQPA